jgi:hypothetical protein
LGWPRGEFDSARAVLVKSKAGPSSGHVEPVGERFGAGVEAI